MPLDLLQNSIISVQDMWHALWYILLMQEMESKFRANMAAIHYVCHAVIHATSVLSFLIVYTCM